MDYQEEMLRRLRELETSYGVKPIPKGKAFEIFEATIAKYANGSRGPASQLENAMGAVNRMLFTYKSRLATMDYDQLSDAIQEATGEAKFSPKNLPYAALLADQKVDQRRTKTAGDDDSIWRR